MPLATSPLLRDRCQQMGLLSNAKDRLIQSAALSQINSRIAPYGQLTCLNIDSAAKLIDLELELKGEASPIHVTVSGYTVVEENGRFFVSANSVSTSRAWLTVLAQERVCQSRIEVPPAAGNLLKRFL